MSKHLTSIKCANNLKLEKLMGQYRQPFNVCLQN